MLKMPSPLIQSPVFFEKAVIPDRFSILCWNVHKENLRPGFAPLIQDWKKTLGLDLLLFQEARFFKTLFSIAGFPYVGAANIRLPGHYAGVVTAACAGPFTTRFQRTRTREPLVFTPKNSLITIYRFQNRSPLMVVNVHAINFRSSFRYQWELSRLYDLLKGFEGAMVVAGDFNCWQRRRKKMLENMAHRLALAFQPPRHGEHIKTLFGYHLDRIYARGLMASDVTALDCRSFSDHNPIVARFERFDAPVKYPD